MLGFNTAESFSTEASGNTLFIFFCNYLDKYVILLSLETQESMRIHGTFKMGWDGYSRPEKNREQNNSDS